MGPFAAGEVILVHFPFSDLTASKLRPAVVLADAGRGDSILCQVTSKPYGDSKAILLEAKDFARGSLRLASYARHGKLFTAHGSLVANQIGVLGGAKFSSIQQAVLRMIQTGS